MPQVLPWHCQASKTFAACKSGTIYHTSNAGLIIYSGDPLGAPWQTLPNKRVRIVTLATGRRLVQLRTAFGQSAAEAIARFHAPPSSAVDAAQQWTMTDCSRAFAEPGQQRWVDNLSVENQSSGIMPQKSTSYGRLTKSPAGSRDRVMSAACRRLDNAET